MFLIKEDFLGNEVTIGDKVVVCRKNYRDFVIAEVIGLTPKAFRVRYKASWDKDREEVYLTPYAILAT